MMSRPSTKLIRQPTPLKTGIVWNIASLGFLALAGLALNIAIGRFYGSEALGVFNIAFALYIFISQFAAFGIHLSALEGVSRLTRTDATDEAHLSRVISSAILAVALTATIATLLALLATPIVTFFYRESAPGISVAYLAILPGLWAFSINKVLLGITNGARQMRTFASLQALRYILLLICFIAFLMGGVPAPYLTAVFSITEFILLIFTFMAARKTFQFWSIPVPAQALREHGWFGARVFLAGAVLEINTRIDILMLGFFMGASKAGVYTIAALFVDGMSQVIFAMRNSINPEITQSVQSPDRSGLLGMSRKTALLMPLALLVLSGIAWLLFPLFCDLVLDDPTYLEGHLPLLILLIGLSISSGVIVFNMALSQLGKPGIHTLYVTAILIVNAILNFFLIPLYGLNGAAAATASSFVFSAVLLIVIVRRATGLRLVV